MCVLGAMLLDEECIPDMFRLVSCNDFSVAAHKEVFLAIIAVYATSDDATDCASVVAELERRGTLDVIGGKEYILELAECVPSAAAAMENARLVCEAAGLRRSGVEDSSAWPPIVCRDAWRSLINATEMDMRAGLHLVVDDPRHPRRHPDDCLGLAESGMLMDSAVKYLGALRRYVGRRGSARETCEHRDTFDMDGIIHCACGWRRCPTCGHQDQGEPVGSEDDECLS
jgi:hypothetical protein